MKKIITNSSFVVVLFIIFFMTSCKKNDSSSTNGWQIVVVPFFGKAQNIKFSNADTGYILSVSFTPYIHNVITRTYDGGKTWMQIHYSQKFFNDTSIGNMLSIYPYPYNSTILFAARSELLRSVNGGYNYQKVDVVNKIGTPLMCFLDAKIGISAGLYITKTTDSGMNWKKIFTPPGFGNGFQYLQFPSNSVGYAAGGVSLDATNIGTMAKTTDGGETWKLLTFPPHNVTSMYFVSPSTGFAGISLDSASIATTYRRGCALYKTTDYGETWTLVYPDFYATYQAYVENLYFKNEQEGYFSSSVGIFHTTDGGRSWQKEFSNYISYMCVTRGNIAYAIDSAGVVLKKGL